MNKKHRLVAKHTQSIQDRAGWIITAKIAAIGSISWRVLSLANCERAGIIPSR